LLQGRVRTSIGNFWKVMEIDNAFFQDMESFGKKGFLNKLWKSFGFLSRKSLWNSLEWRNINIYCICMFILLNKLLNPTRIKNQWNNIEKSLFLSACKNAGVLKSVYWLHRLKWGSCVQISARKEWYSTQTPLVLLTLWRD